jgi:hypothetical protein
MPSLTRRSASRLAVIAAALLAALAAIAMPGVAEGLAFLLPAVVLLVVLVVRRYPGERVLSRLRERRVHVAPAVRRVAAHAGRAARSRVRMPRGGRLIAASLAVRPPPLRRCAVLS